MAEYLCEEDMNTGEYISRDEALKIFHQCCDNCTSSYNGVMCRACADADAMDILIDMPSADVQPVNQWISFKDRLPEPEKDVLIWYRETWGAGFTSYRFGISRWFSKRKRWYEGYLPKDFEVLYWQPLPEPPKDGEHND